MGADPSFAGEPVVRRWKRGVSPNGQPSPGAEPAAAAASAGAPADQRSADRTPADDGELFERLVDALEQRVLDELERRGHRHAPGVF